MPDTDTALPGSLTGPLAGCVKTLKLRGTKGQSVIPAKAGIQGSWRRPYAVFPTPLRLDSRFRGNDDFSGRCLSRDGVLSTAC